jgi:chitinase
MEPSAVPWDLLTHVCFAFGTINLDYSINITAGETLMSTVFSTALANGVKPVLSIGGWGFGSSMYSAMVSTNASRAAFVSSLHDLVDQYGITGIDIDWEYPGRPSDESVPYSPLDYINLVLLLQYFKAEFGDTLTISAAVAATTPYSEDISEMADLFDWVGLMFYDFATGPQTTTVSDSPLKGPVSAESGTEAWHEAGLPYDKMVFGIPSYGRSFTLVDVSPPTNPRS